MPLSRGRRRRRPAEFDWQKSACAGADILERAGVPYVVIGRVAVWSYVEPDAQGPTKDVDFAVPHERITDAARAAEELGYSVQDLGREIGGYRIVKGDVRVDFIDGGPRAAMLFSEAIGASGEEGDTIEVQGRELPVAPVSHLVAMKLLSARAKDMGDVREIVAEATEQEYRRLRQDVEDLIGFGWGNQLDRVAREIGHPGPGPERGL